MKLNLGCGHNKRPGWVNVDHSDTCSPDVVVDLEQTPWPWPDDSVDEVLMSHVLEHLGQQTRTYLAIWQELYRVCKPGALLLIFVPHPRHDDYITDPTHVRPILPEGVALFSQKENRKTIAGGFANTPLGIQLGIDFDVVKAELVPAPWYVEARRTGAMSAAELVSAGERWNNVYREVRMLLRAVKPAGSSGR